MTFSIRGAGVGLSRGGNRWFALFPGLCCFFALVVAFAGPLDLTHLYIPQQDDLKL